MNNMNLLAVKHPYVDIGIFTAIYVKCSATHASTSAWELQISAFLTFNRGPQIPHSWTAPAAAPKVRF